jgi:hypothetical protein
MGEIVNIGNLDLCFYRISFCSLKLIWRIIVSVFLKIRLFVVRKADRDELIQFDTNFQWYLFEISRNKTFKGVSSGFATIYF